MTEQELRDALSSFIDQTSLYAVIDALSIVVWGRAEMMTFGDARENLEFIGRALAAVSVDAEIV